MSVDPTLLDTSVGLDSRQEQILTVVNEQGYATLEALAERFSVSIQTIRRDIIQLDKANLLQRVHGGASATRQAMRMEYEQKSTLNFSAKRRIADIAASLASESGSIYLDVGTTSEALANALLAKPPKIVITNSMPVATILASAPNVNVIVTGGFVSGKDGSLTGDIALHAMGLFKVDVAFIACSGFDSDGAAMDFDLNKISIKHAAIRSCRKAVLLADSTKFAREALVRLASPQAFSALISDRIPDPKNARESAIASSYTVLTGT